MKTSPRTMRRAVTGAIGAGALSAAMLFGSIPAAGASPAPAPAVGFAMAGPGAAVVPAGWGHYPGWHGWHGWVNGRWWNRW